MNGEGASYDKWVDCMYIIRGCALGSLQQIKVRFFYVSGAAHAALSLPPQLVRFL